MKSHIFLNHVVIHVWKLINVRLGNFVNDFLWYQNNPLKMLIVHSNAFGPSITCLPKTKGDEITSSKIGDLTDSRHLSYLKDDIFIEDSLKAAAFWWV